MLTTSANPAAENAEVTFVATVANLETDVVPFGSVQFLIDGEAIEPLPLDDDGQAGIVVSFEPGDYDVRARYHDDTAAIADFRDSQASLTQRISSSPAPPTAPPPASPPAPSPAPPTVTPLPPSPANNAFTPGGSITLAVRPNSKARGALARGRTLRVNLSIRFQSAKGGSVRTRRTSVLVKGRRTARRGGYLG